MQTVVEPVLAGEASVGRMLRSTWRYTLGRRHLVAAAAALALCLFALSAVLPLLTGRLLDTALAHANTGEQAKRFVTEWLAIQDTTRQVLANDTSNALDAASVATGVRAATSQAIAARPDEYLKALFPSGLRYDVSGPLGQRLRAQFDNSNADWVEQVKDTLADGHLQRDEVERLLMEQDNRTPQDAAEAFSFVVANLSLEDLATQQRDHWRRSTFIRDLLLLGGVIAAVAVLRMLTLRITLRITLGGATRLQGDVFERVHDTTIVNSGVLGRPSMVSRCSTYVEHVQSAMTGLLTRGIAAGANLALSTTILLWIDPITGAMMCGLLVLFEVLRRVLSPRWSRAVHRKLDDNTRLSEVADDAISNSASIRAAGAEPVQRRLFARQAERVRASAVRIDTISEVFDFAAFAFGQVGVLLAVALIGFARGGISLGEATASILYVRAMSEAIGALPGVVVSLQEAAPYMRRLDRVLAFPLRRPPSATAAATSIAPPLTLSRVTFTPPDGSKGCTDIDMELVTGQWSVLVGQQRSTRDAVVLMASGLDLPDKGDIRLGVTSLASLDLATLRRSVALLVPQPYLADTTLDENIRLARPDASPDDVAVAVEQAGLREWIDQLPSGLTTVVGRRGHHVPKAMRLRVGLARTLVAESPVVVIDDPTDGLDREAAEALWAIMRAALADRAVLIATARLDLINADDIVFVLAGGTVAESGTVDHLLRHSSQWSKLWSRHSGGGDPVEALQAFPTLQRFSEPVLQRAARRFAVETFDDGETVFEAGEPADRLFIVVRGAVELWDGDRRVATLHDGDHFGEFDPTFDAASDSRRPITARALGTTTLNSLQRSAFAGGALQVLDRSPAERSVYRLLARNGALSAAEVAAELPHLDTEAALDALLSGGSLTRSIVEGVTVWRIAGEARRATRSRAHLLDDFDALP